jgi:hypothetical protein
VLGSRPGSRQDRGRRGARTQEPGRYRRTPQAVHQASLGGARHKLGAGGASANGNFVMNRPRHHGQNLLGDFGHVMRGGDVVHSLSENFLCGIAARFKPAAGNEVMTEKNLCHTEPPKQAWGWREGAKLDASRVGRLVNGTHVRHGLWRGKPRPSKG